MVYELTVVKTLDNFVKLDIPLFHIMCQPRKQTKGKSKDSAPKAPLLDPQKTPNPNLMLRVPPLSVSASCATAQPERPEQPEPPPHCQSVQPQDTRTYSGS